MVESYQKVMNPPPGLIETLVRETADPEIKWKTLEEARNRAEWERGKRKREDERQKEQNEEAEAMGLIDWQDFVVVETIEFTQTDLDLELPPPTNVEKLKTMSMAEKRMASMVMEETGAGPTGTGQVAPDNDATEEMDMEEDDETEEVKLQRLKEEQEQARARDVQRAAMQSRGVKIRTDYTPKGESLTSHSVARTTCYVCHADMYHQESSEVAESRRPSVPTVASRSPRTSYPSTCVSSYWTRNGRSKNGSWKCVGTSHCKWHKEPTCRPRSEISLLSVPICLATTWMKPSGNARRKRPTRSAESERESSGTVIPTRHRGRPILSNPNSRSTTRSKRCTREWVSG